jgi:hypothetical protein
MTFIETVAPADADGPVADMSILAAAVRCFFSKVLDATGALPDRRFAELPEALRDLLTVGRPIEPGNV